MLGYQNWFYPIQNKNYLSRYMFANLETNDMDYFNERDSNPFIDMDFNTTVNYTHVNQNIDSVDSKYSLWHLHSRLPGIYYSQPRISLGRQCVAMAVVGYQHFTRKWMKIDCSQYFNNITVICVSHAQGYLQPSSRHIDQSIYADIEHVKRKDGVIRIAKEYCVEGWYHVKSQCHKISPVRLEACITFSVSANENPLLRHIFQHFTDAMGDHLFICSTNTTTESLMMVHGLHQCKDFTFIAEHHVCDGEADCPDASDEMNCDDVCTFFEPVNNLSCYTMCTSDICACNKMYFQCSSGGCISLSKFCDGIIDCQDMSDEILCVNESHVPDEVQFRCLSGNAIGQHLVNDTVPDCPVYGDDEVWPSGCLSTGIVVDGSVMIACIPGHPKLFDFHLLCQLTWNTAGHLSTCRNGAHLSDCIYHSCPHQYKCAYSYCIPVQAVCDGRVDCPDGSDEADCQNHLCPHLLKCKTKNACVHKNDVNDGVTHCPAFKDDEITKGISSCPTECDCVGHAVYCMNNELDSFINQVSFARALVLKIDKPLNLYNINFSHFVNIRYLDLSHNRINNIKLFSFKGLQSLVKLLITNVPLSVIPQNCFQNLLNTKEIALIDNNVTRIETYAFRGMISLTILDLSHQMLSAIQPCSFHGLHALVLLNLSYNVIEIANQGLVCGLHSLQILDLTGNSITNVDPTTFKGLLNLRVLESSVQGMCCYVNIVGCSPQFDDDFASCTNILALSMLQYSVWSVAILSITENIVALFVLQSAKTGSSKKKLIHNLIQKQLSLSDVIMGVYFLIVAIFDNVYEGHFIQIASLWKDGLQCKILSFISLLSFEMTLYTVFIMSLGRFVAVCMPMKTMLTKMKLARAIAIIGWIVGIFIAAFPVGTLYFHQRGLNNVLCVMMLSFEHLNAWYVLIVLILNTTMSICNIIMYSSIIHSLRRRQKRLTEMARQQQSGHLDVTITVRIVCVVLTNSTCWMVMVIVGSLLKSGLIIEPKIFSMCTVIVLPISALLNPILNVFTTSDFIKVFKNIKRRK